MTTIDKIRAEIQKALDTEREFTSENAKAQALGMKLMIDIPEERYKDIQRIASVQAARKHFQTAEQIIANGTPIPENATVCDIDAIRETRDEKIIDAIDFAIKATDSQDDYSMGMRNGMRYVKSLIDGKEPQFELRMADEETKLGIYLGDEVVGNHGVKGVVVGIDTYEGDVLLSLLMRNHKVPQLVKASMYKTKTGRHFPQIVEVLEQIKEDKE